MLCPDQVILCPWDNDEISKYFSINLKTVHLRPTYLRLHICSLLRKCVKYFDLSIFQWT